MAEPITATSFGTYIDRDGSAVLVTFASDAGEEVRVEVPSRQLPALVRALQKRLEPGQETPIDLPSLRPGRQIEVVSYEIETSEDGGALIRLSAQLFEPTRMVTIPLKLVPGAVWDLISDLQGAIRRGSRTATD